MGMSGQLCNIDSMTGNTHPVYPPWLLSRALGGAAVSFLYCASGLFSLFNWLMSGYMGKGVQLWLRPQLLRLHYRENYLMCQTRMQHNLIH